VQEKLVTQAVGKAFPGHQKQTQAPVPDVPGLSILTYRPSDNQSWRSDYRDPLTGAWTCTILGRRPEMSYPEAVAAHMHIQTMVAEGLSPRATKLTVDRAVTKKVFPHAKAKGKKSLRDDQSRYRSHLKDQIGHLQIGKLTPRLIQQVADEVRAKLNPATAEKVAALLKAICRDFVVLRLLPTNPASDLKLLPVENARQRIPTDEEAARLGEALGAVPASTANDCIKFKMFTGTRDSEARNLRFGDIDEGQGVMLLRETKSGRPQTVPLSPEAMAIVVRRKALRINDYLFPSASGRGAISYPRKAFSKLLERAGITGLTMHDLRRWYGTAGIQSPGVTVHDVSKLLRHSSIHVTEKHYLVAVDSRLRRAANQASRSVYELLGLDRRARTIPLPSCRSIRFDTRYAFVMGC
jgi:integrase